MSHSCVHQRNFSNVCTAESRSGLADRCHDNTGGMGGRVVMVTRLNFLGACLQSLRIVSGLVHRNRHLRLSCLAPYRQLTECSLLRNSDVMTLPADATSRNLIGAGMIQCIVMLFCFYGKTMSHAGFVRIHTQTLKLCSIGFRPTQL